MDPINGVVCPTPPYQWGGVPIRQAPEKSVAEDIVVVLMMPLVNKIPYHHEGILPLPT